MAFIFVRVTSTPTELTGLIDDADYAGQNSPDDLGSFTQAPIFYSKLDSSDDAPDRDTTERAVILAFGTGRFSPVDGETIWVWTPGGETTLVLEEQ